MDQMNSMRQSTRKVNQLSCADSLANRIRKQPNFFKFETQPNRSRRVRFVYRKKTTITSTRTRTSKKNTNVFVLNRISIAQSQPIVALIKNYNYSNNEYFETRNNEIGVQSALDSKNSEQESVLENFSVDFLDYNFINDQLLKNFNIDAFDLIGRDIVF